MVGHEEEREREVMGTSAVLPPPGSPSLPPKLPVVLRNKAALRLKGGSSEV